MDPYKPIIIGESDDEFGDEGVPPRPGPPDVIDLSGTDDMDMTDAHDNVYQEQGDWQNQIPLQDLEEDTKPIAGYISPPPDENFERPPEDHGDEDLGGRGDDDPDKNPGRDILHNFPKELVDRVSHQLYFHHQCDRRSDAGVTKLWDGDKVPQTKKASPMYTMTLKTGAIFFLAMTNYGCKAYSPLLVPRSPSKMSDLTSDEWDEVVRKTLTQEEIASFRKDGKPHGTKIRTWLWSKVYEKFISKEFVEKILDAEDDDDDDDDDQDDNYGETEPNEAIMTGSLSPKRTTSDLGDDEPWGDGDDPRQILKRLFESPLTALTTFERNLMQELEDILGQENVPKTLVDMEVPRQIKAKIDEMVRDDKREEVGSGYEKIILLGRNGFGKSTAINNFFLSCEQTSNLYGTFSRPNQSMIEFVLEEIFNELSPQEKVKAGCRLLDEFVTSIADDDKHKKHFVSWHRPPPGVSESLTKDIQKELEARRKIRDYHRTKSLEGLRQYGYLFPVGSTVSSTTEVGKGVRFGPQFALVVRFKSLNDVKRDLINHDWSADARDLYDNDITAFRMRKNMENMLNVLKTGLFHEGDDDDDDDDEDSGEKQQTAPTKSGDIEVCEDILQLDGKTMVFTAPGHDKIVDQIYIRNKIADFSAPTDPISKARRLMVDDMIVYCPCALFEGKKVELRDIPGCGETDPTKVSRLMTEIDQADHVIVTVPKTLSEADDVTTIMRQHLIPRYINSKSESTYTLLSSIRANSKFDEHLSMNVESLLERVESAIEEEDVLNAQFYSLLPETVPPTERETLLSLFNQCLLEAKSNGPRANRRLEIDFLIMPEKGDPISETEILEDLTKFEADRDTREKATRKTLRELCKFGPKKGLSNRVLNELKYKPRVISLYPFLYTSLVTSHQAEMDDDSTQVCSEEHKDHSQALKLSGGREWLRIFDSIEMRHLTRGVKKVVSLCDTCNVAQKAHVFFNEIIQHDPRLVECAKKLHKNSVRDKFLAELAGPAERIFSELTPAVDEKYAVWGADEEKEIHHDICKLFEKHVEKNVRDLHKKTIDSRRVVRFMSNSEQMRPFFLKVLQVLRKSNIFSKSVAIWGGCTEKIKERLKILFSENLKKEVLLQLGHNAPESLKTKAAVEIAKLMEKQSSSILDESFSQRGALDWLKRQRAVNRKGSYRYLWQAGMKDVYTLELCSEFFLLNANEFIENPKEMFSQRLSDFLVAVKHKTKEFLTQTVWRRACAKSLEKFRKAKSIHRDNRSVAWRLYRTFWQSFLVDMKGKQCMARHLDRLGQKLQEIRNTAVRLDEELLRREIANSDAAETRILKMRILDNFCENCTRRPEMPIGSKLRKWWSKRTCSTSDCPKRKAATDVSEFHSFFTALSRALTNCEWEKNLLSYNLHRSRRADGTLFNALAELMEPSDGILHNLTRTYSTGSPFRKRRRLFKNIMIFIAVCFNDVHGYEFERLFRMSVAEFQTKCTQWEAKEMSEENDGLPRELVVPILLGFASLHSVNLDIILLNHEEHDPSAPIMFYRISPFPFREIKFQESPISLQMTYDAKDGFVFTRKKDRRLEFKVGSERSFGAEEPSHQFIAETRTEPKQTDGGSGELLRKSVNRRLREQVYKAHRDRGSGEAAYGGDPNNPENPNPAIEYLRLDRWTCEPTYRREKPFKYSRVLGIIGEVNYYQLKSLNRFYCQIQDKGYFVLEHQDTKNMTIFRFQDDVLQHMGLIPQEVPVLSFSGPLKHNVSSCSQIHCPVCEVLFYRIDRAIVSLKQGKRVPDNRRVEQKLAKLNEQLALRGREKIVLPRCIAEWASKKRKSDLAQPSKKKTKRS